MRLFATVVLLCACSNDGTADKSDAGKTITRDPKDAPSADPTTTAPDVAAPAPSATSSCGVAAARTCPTVKPSYAKQVAPILDAKCNDCHLGGIGQPWSLADYQSVDDWRVSIRDDIVNCTMPPLDGGIALTAEERDVILGWIACDAPKN